MRPSSSSRWPSRDRSAPERLKSAAIVKFEMAKQESSAPERLKSAAIVKFEMAKQEVERTGAAEECGHRQVRDGKQKSRALGRLKSAAIVAANAARMRRWKLLTVRKEIEMAPSKARLAAEEAVEVAKLRAKDEVESAKTAVLSAQERLARKLHAALHVNYGE